jgi:hypothetical protein
MKKVTMLFTLVIFMMVYGLPVAALAQSNTGSLSGTVSGPDGVIPDAKVVVTDSQTGKERILTTSAEGTFTVSQLDAGLYTVKVTAPGFKTFTANEVKVDVARQYEIRVGLEVGAVDETVTVTAGEELINTVSGEIGKTVNQRQIQELPLNGRNPLALVTLQAGTSSNGAQVTVINGQQSSFTNITRDGINVQDNFIRSNAVDFIPDRPNVDDTGEFTIITQNAGAELGYGSSQIQLVTPRGSNAFHGAAFIYNRNSKLAANDFFRNANKQERPFLNRNQYGGRMSGPVIKDKLFFFGSFELFRLRQSQANPANLTILLPQAHQGLFTYLDNTTAANGGPVRRTVNVLQIAGVSPDAAVRSRFLDKLPTSGNTTAVGDQLNTTGFAISAKSNQDRNAYTTRIDYDINQSNSISGTYSYRKEDLLRPDVTIGFEGPLATQDAHTKFLSLSYRMNPTATLSNEIRGGYQKSDPFFHYLNETNPNFVGLPLISNPEGGFRDQGRDTGIYNLQDNAVWAKGQHNIRFGGQWQLFDITATNNVGNKPTYNLGVNVNTPQITTAQFTTAALFPGGISTAQRTAANSLVALLGGIINTANQTFNATSKESGLLPDTTLTRKLRYDNISFYVSDQWRVRPNITLNFGLRYELFTPISNPDGLVLEPVVPDGKTIEEAILDPNGQTNFVGGIAGGNRFFKSDKNNFAPVFSIAYSPNFESGFLKRLFPGDGKTVIRGGYRMSYVNDEFVRGADNALSGNPGLSVGASAINPATNTTALGNARLGGNLPTIAGPALVVPRTYAFNNSVAAGGGLFGTVFAIDPNLQVPRTQEYNISFEREIGFQMALEIRYVGGRSNNLIRGIDLNQVDIRSNGFLEDFKRARANFILTGNAACVSAGCQTLTVFPRLGSGGLLTNSTITGLLVNGVPADLAVTYVTNNLAGSVKFLPNPNAGAVDLLKNAAKYRYNSLQVELRKRFSNGLYFQSNYTFQKTLTDSSGLGQTNFEPLLDNASPDLEYSRAVFDTAQVFNFNTIYELPFGKGKRFLSDGGISDRVFGGWQVQTIMRASTGAPITVTDVTGTLNRNARAGRQTPQTNLNKEEIKRLTGIFKTSRGIFFFNPAITNTTGRAAEGFANARFGGQVFFNNGPGETGDLENFFLNGPIFFNWDASIIKNIPIKENLRVQVRAEAFNVLNRANFFVGQAQAVGSTNFGRITSTFGPRIVQLVGRIEF